MKGDGTVKIKLRVISAISALCFLGSIACFSAFAAEMLDKPSGDEDVGYTEQPAEPIAEEPVTPEPYVPEPVEPEPTDPGYVDSGYVEPDPGYVDSEITEPDPGYEDPSYTSEPDYSAAYSDLISDGNFPQPDVSTAVSTYVDNTQQYNQYIANQNMAQYDDNYIYIPEYEEPTTSLVTTASKVIDTDELTGDDWDSIILDLSNGNLDNDGTKTFSFIKDNEAEGDTDMMWMVYLGTALIIVSVLLIIFVIVTTTKANSKTQDYYYV